MSSQWSLGQSKSQNKLLTIGVPLLFLPAAIGLGMRFWSGPAWDQRCLGLALLLLCLDQARMAGVDLANIAAVRSQLAHRGSVQTDSRLDRFRWFTLSTIGIELIGFYWAIIPIGPNTLSGSMLNPEAAVSTGAISTGAIIVLLSQLWFHLQAGIQLWPENSDPIQDFGIRARVPVLIADTVGILLLVLWQLQVARLVMAIAILAMILIYGLTKYGVELLSIVQRFGSQENPIKSSKD